MPSLRQSHHRLINGELELWEDCTGDPIPPNDAISYFNRGVAELCLSRYAERQTGLYVLHKTSVRRWRHGHLNRVHRPPALSGMGCRWSVLGALAGGTGTLPELMGLVWSWLSMDGAMTKSPFGGRKNRPQPQDRGKASSVSC